MNKLDLARRLAKQSHRSRGKAADDVDSLVHRLLRGVKQSPKPSVTAASAPEPRPSRES